MIWIGQIGMKKEDELFVDSEYLFMIQLFNIKLERVTERGRLKLHPTEVMDVRLGRSKNQFIHSISLSINNEVESSSHLPRSAPSPSLIEFKCGRSIIYSFKSFKYLISLLIKNNRMQNHLIQWNSNEEDLFISNIQSSIIPFISNEEQKKLYDVLPISPILIVDNLGRFFNSNPPP